MSVLQWQMPSYAVLYPQQSQYVYLPADGVSVQPPVLFMEDSTVEVQIHQGRPKCCTFILLYLFPWVCFILLDKTWYMTVKCLRSFCYICSLCAKSSVILNEVTYHIIILSWLLRKHAVQEALTLSFSSTLAVSWANSAACLPSVSSESRRNGTCCSAGWPWKGKKWISLL